LQQRFWVTDARAGRIKNPTLTAPHGHALISRLGKRNAPMRVIQCPDKGELEKQNPTEEPVHEQELVSTTDPDSTYATKGGTPARMGYYDNYLVDNPSCVIVGVQATAAHE
jgi:hypothetical protein